MYTAITFASGSLLVFAFFIFGMVFGMVITLSTQLKGVHPKKIYNLDTEKESFDYRHIKPSKDLKSDVRKHL